MPMLASKLPDKKAAIAGEISEWRRSKLACAIALGGLHNFNNDTSSNRTEIMSLFASAFDTGAGPSNISSTALGKPHKDGKQKKKRPSTGGGGGGQVDLRATEANLAKLMKKVEAGEVKGKHEGGENMGGSGKKSKKRKGDQDGGRQGQVEQTACEQEGGNKKRKQVNGSTVIPAPSPMKSKPTTTPKANKDGKSIGKGEKPAPAELPLPHSIPKSQLHSDAVVDEKLTDMQKSMQAKLEGARFRWINEQLYSNPSVDAVEMMKREPKIFEDVSTSTMPLNCKRLLTGRQYHQTHRALTSAWPSPPLPHLVKLLTPLPEKTLIVDLGCGDAGLAKALVPQGKIVLSYDLVGDSGSPGQLSAGAASSTKGSASGGWVCEADFLQHVPLPGRPGGLAAASALPNGVDAGATQQSKSQKRRRKQEKARDGSSEMVDVVVCCLSLMGTNWIGGIYEACRVMKQGSVAWSIACGMRILS